MTPWDCKRTLCPIFMTLLEICAVFKEYGSHWAGKILNSSISLVLSFTPYETGITKGQIWLRQWRVHKDFMDFKLQLVLRVFSQFKFLDILPPFVTMEQSHTKERFLLPLWSIALSLVYQNRPWAISLRLKTSKS